MYVSRSLSVSRIKKSWIRRNREVKEVISNKKIFLQHVHNFIARKDMNNVGIINKTAKYFYIINN